MPMEIFDAAALVVIVLAGGFLVGLGLVSMFAPGLAVPFLESFAGSAFAHYLELSLRLAVGAAFVVYAPRMPLAAVFAVYGWVIVVTTVVLFAVPWRWHRWFAERSVPPIVRWLRLFAVVSFALGSAILTAAFMAVNRTGG